MTKRKKNKPKTKPKKKPTERESNQAIYLEPPPIFMWDRSALIIWVKQTFVDWLNRLPDNEPGHSYTLDSVNSEPSLYLLPPYEFDDQREELLALVAPTIFVKQLENWCTEPNWWPKNLKNQNFSD